MSLTRRLILQKARHHPTQNEGSDGLWAHGFRYSFTPLPGYFSPFPHGTNPLSVIRKYSGLPGGPGRFTADSTSPLLLGDIPREPSCFRLRVSHLLRKTIPGHCDKYNGFYLPPWPAHLRRNAPQHRTRNPRRVTHARGLA